MSEYINGIKILKYSGWEEFALKRIKECRDKEIKEIYRMN